ncbi:MAG: cytochrome c oxidase subunit II [Planctomycetes bacterium TMED75]|nr:cytochrome c oxidase subunit II [Planctomycetaceae bacterium]OUU94127.1 MAG: cytochrome c oxidase subunit II [Planctomycetes bacterium TMED75]
MISSLCGMFEGVVLLLAEAGSEPTPSNFWMPEGASKQAPFIDLSFYIINWINYFFFGLVTLVLVWFSFRYRQRSKHVEFSEGPVHNTTLEVTWTVIPTLILIGIFFMGFIGYLDLRTPPKDAFKINVTAQQWAWEFEYPNGAKSTSELVIPAGRPVQLVMRSKDVLHSLYIPDFRVKQDVVPGRYTYLWFESDVVTDPDDESDFFWLFCTEYCGDSHWNMNVHVRVFPDEDFEEWTKEQARWLDVIPEQDLYFMAGPKLYKRCVTCHSLDGIDGSGPSWGPRNGLPAIWDRVVKGEGEVSGGSKFIAGKNKLSDYIGDGKLYETPEAYIRESIYNPGALLVAGYGNQMPTFQGQLNDRAIDAVIGMMKNIDQFNADGSFKDQAMIEEAEARIAEAKAAAIESTPAEAPAGAVSE